MLSVWGRYILCIPTRKCKKKIGESEAKLLQTICQLSLTEINKGYTI